MTARLLATLAVILVLGGLVVAGYVLSKRHSRDVTPGSPDRVTDDVVSGLMNELRKWQAEAAYWKSVAERLQRNDHGH